LLRALARQTSFIAEHILAERNNVILPEDRKERRRWSDVRAQRI